MLTQSEMAEIYFDKPKTSFENLSELRRKLQQKKAVEKLRDEALASLSEEDPRKTALKKGLRQLTLTQLYRVMNHTYATNGQGIVLDEYTYKNGKFCPLAIGVGLNESFKDPTNEKVFSVLVLMGYTVFNTRGIEGDFYKKDRLADLITATLEVIEEKKKVYAEELKQQNLLLQPTNTFKGILHGEATRN